MEANGWILFPRDWEGPAPTSWREKLMCESGDGKWRGITTNVLHLVRTCSEERGRVEAWMEMSRGLGQPSRLCKETPSRHLGMPSWDGGPWICSLQCQYWLGEDPQAVQSHTITSLLYHISGLETYLPLHLNRMIYGQVGGQTRDKIPSHRQQ